MKRISAVLIIVVVVAAALAATFVYMVYYRTSGEGPCGAIPSEPSPNSGNSTAAADRPTANFLIVEADRGPYEGMNGSAFHIQENWPVMLVHQGQTVVIHVLNCASSEAHGFAIAHYFESGVALQSGGTYTLNFTANQKGTFRVYCSIFCTIHASMQNGKLIVS